MMDLNLLPSQAKFQAKKMFLRKRVRMFMGLLLIVWVFGISVILLLFFLAKGKLNIETKKFDKAQAEFKALSENIIVNQRLKFRAKLVGKVLTERFEYGKSFKTINGLLPEEIKVENFDLKQQSQFLIQASSQSFKAIDKIESLVKTINDGKIDGFSGARIKSLSYANGSWKFDLEVNIK